MLPIISKSTGFANLSIYRLVDGGKGVVPPFKIIWWLRFRPSYQWQPCHFAAVVCVFYICDVLHSYVFSEFLATFPPSKCFPL